MIYEGKTVEEAISTGLQALSVKEEEVTINIIEEPTKGLFGKLKGKAVVEIEKIKTGEERANEFLQKLLNILDINAKTNLILGGENPVINIIAEKSSEVIGYRGEMLDAIQTLASAVANIGNKTYKKVCVDCENYREKRENTLKSLAIKLEAKATEMKREVILESMPAYERRIIHMALAESKTVITASEGKEPNRYVVIVPNEKDETKSPYNAGRKGFENKSNGRKGGEFGRKKSNGSGFTQRNKTARTSGFTGEKRKSSVGFGTYLGNSLKD